jgi:mannose-6-phosphate isomerase
MDAVRISAQLKDFPWGGLSFLQSLVQRPDRMGVPIGELWMGIHPNAPSTVLDTGENLASFLARNPRFLGDLREFPFLLKVMAIERPLSIQCHPDAKQAQKGWEGEAEKRKVLDRAVWNYQDANPKAEMLVALTETTAMCGFLSAKQIEKNFKKVLPQSYQRLLSHCEKQSDPVRCFVQTLYRLDKQTLEVTVAEYQEALEAQDEKPNPPFLNPSEIARQAVAQYGADPGVFGPYLLQVIHLEPGAGIFLKPGVVHAYVKGNGIELMNNSDNILRAGLTDKHVDYDELFSIMDTSYKQVEEILTTEEEGKFCYQTDDPFFSLCRFERGSYDETQTSVSLLFCIEGSLEVSKDSQRLSCGKGECLLLGAGLEQYHLDVDGCVYRASYPAKR